MTATMDEDKEECGCGWCVEVGEEALLARGRGDGVVIVLFLVILYFPAEKVAHDMPRPRLTEY